MSGLWTRIKHYGIHLLLHRPSKGFFFFRVFVFRTFDWVVSIYLNSELPLGGWVLTLHWREKLARVACSFLKLRYDFRVAYYYSTSKFATVGGYYTTLMLVCPWPVTGTCAYKPNRLYCYGLPEPAWTFQLLPVGCLEGWKANFLLKTTKYKELRAINYAIPPLNLTVTL